LRSTWANKDPISKITGANCTGGLAQVAGQLFCKHETLGSNPSPTRGVKKKKKRKKKENPALNRDKPEMDTSC
jgi:hypothetical protein